MDGMGSEAGKGDGDGVREGDGDGGHTAMTDEIDEEQQGRCRAEGVDCNGDRIEEWTGWGRRQGRAMVMV